MNQCIKECDTDFIFYNAWKVKAKYSDLLFAIEKLKDGYGFIDLCYVLISFATHKHLFSKIGFFDEWYFHSHEVDWDFICTLRHYDIAYYQNSLVELIQWRSMQHGTNKNGMFTNVHKFNIKWSHQSDGFKRNFQEKNYKDKNILENIYPDREYMKFKDSYIEYEYIFERCNLFNSGVSLDNIKKFELSDKEKEKFKLVNIEY